MPADQYNAFEGEGANDPYANIRKFMSAKSPGAMPGANVSAPFSSDISPGATRNTPTAPAYGSPVFGGGGTNFPGGGPQTMPQGPWSSTSSLQGSLAGTAVNAGGAENTLINKNQPFLDFMSGAPDQSPLYKSLLTKSRDAISNSYDSAVANTRSNAISRGFGYEQPVEQGAESGVRAQEAGAMSAAPSAALQTTVQEELPAAQLAAQEAAMYANQDTSMMGDVSALQQARMGKTSSMFSSLMQLISAMVTGGSNAGAAQLGKP